MRNQTTFWLVMLVAAILCWYLAAQFAGSMSEAVTGGS